VTFVCKYIALHVPDLRAAESFYRDAFGIELLFRESHDEHGTWHTLRAGLGWDDADARGIGVDMVAVGRNGFVLALFRGAPARGTLYEVSLGVEPAELEALQARTAELATVVESRPELLRFDDPFGFRWVVQRADTSFRSSGEIAGRWVPAV
jgi:catechol 2,3-dioxygenase-like lactoylglutathione lyase family enzyme